ncbi:MAG: hypothetical protein QNJ54_30520 [Prochloraceae cyanobacterium]|nr:hypothetical protein [Prochloraceae cyanobacterium]
MLPQNSPTNDEISSELEEEAIKRFRELALIISEKSQIFRQIDNGICVLYLDFIDCPEECSFMMENSVLLTLAAHQLGLANFLVFQIGSKIKGWAKISPKNDINLKFLKNKIILVSCICLVFLIILISF